MAYQVIPQEERFLQKDHPPKNFLFSKVSRALAHEMRALGCQEIEFQMVFAHCGHFPEGKRTARPNAHLLPHPRSATEPSFRMKFYVEPH